MKNRAVKKNRALDAALLREAALAYLARFSATQKGLEAMLRRKIRRWQQNMMAQFDDHAYADIEQQAADLHAHIGEIVADMMRLGAINDREYTRSRLQGLPRAGRSQRAIKQHLQLKGIDPDLVQEVIEDHQVEDGPHQLSLEEQECAAALVLLRKRKMGPFFQPKIQQETPFDERSQHHKTLQILARAGFSQHCAATALAMTREEAEEQIMRLRAL